jgi:hypothetical protein
MSKSRKSRKSRKSTKRLPKPVKGELGRYKVSLKASERRKILCSKERELGYASVVHHLNLIATLLKNNERAHNIIKGDMEYLHQKYRG